MTTPPPAPTPPQPPPPTPLISFGNLLTNLPATPLPEEQFTALVARGGVRVERIVSTGHASVDWYDQDELEYVAVVSGEAQLLVEGEPGPRTMRPGDWVVLPAHARHRVVSTAADAPTVWLAVHMPDVEHATQL
jgi:cupin 2 domain-containing protein